MDDLLEKFEDLGIDSSPLSEAVENVASNNEFLALCHQFARDLAVLSNQKVPADHSAEALFVFLTASECPLTHLLTTLDASTALSSINNRICMLDFLLSELQAARMIRAHSQNSTTSEESSKSNELFDIDSVAIGVNPSTDLLVTLCDHFQISLSNQSVEKLLLALHPKFVALVAEESHLSFAPLLIKAQNQEIIDILRDIHQGLTSDYCTRRQVLLKRLEVTIQSCLWSQKGETKVKEISETLAPKLSGLKNSHVNFEDLFAANPGIIDFPMVTDHVSTANTGIFIKRHIIGDVPDRNGRVDRGNGPTFQARAAGSEDWTKGGGRGGRGGRAHTNVRPSGARGGMGHPTTAGFTPSSSPATATPLLASSRDLYQQQQARAQQARANPQPAQHPTPAVRVNTPTLQQAAHARQSQPLVSRSSTTASLPGVQQPQSSQPRQQTLQANASTFVPSVRGRGRGRS